MPEQKLPPGPPEAIFWDFSLVLVWLKIHVFEGRFALKDYWVLCETFWPSRKMQIS
jgi:hypothetical protein